MVSEVNGTLSLYPDVHVVCALCMYVYLYVCV